MTSNNPIAAAITGQARTARQTSLSAAPWGNRGTDRSRVARRLSICAGQSNNGAEKRDGLLSERSQVRLLPGAPSLDLHRICGRAPYDASSCSRASRCRWAMAMSIAEAIGVTSREVCANR
jgi:hypothetical protein